MKQWVKKLIEQFEVEGVQTEGMTEEKATLLHFLDVYQRHLIELDSHPVRRAREDLDRFGKGLVQSDKVQVDKLMFELRQWFSSYRLDETTYIQNTFDDFKRIVWDFADQLSEELKEQKANDDVVNSSLSDLREAVESNSIDDLRTKSREFINFYLEHQGRKDDRRQKRLGQVRKSLNSVKKQLIEANQSMRTDHLTGALNRRSFDERMKDHWRMFQLDGTPCTLIHLDIDHFKKVNDTYGHDIGDFVLKECVSLLSKGFCRPEDVVARTGGEEFTVILPGLKAEEALSAAEACRTAIMKEVFVQGEHQIRFTVSMGIASVLENESCEQWVKRADTALYQSKNSGRNKVTVATTLKAAA